MAVQGVQEVKASMRRLASGGRNAARTAAFAGARYFRDLARAEAKSFSKQGWRGIYAVRTRSDAAETRMDRRGPAFHLLFRERGTKAHIIAAKSSFTVRDVKTKAIIGKRARSGRRRALLFHPFKGSGLELFRLRVSHPGQPARPWFAPTWQKNRARVLERVELVYMEQLQKQAEKKGI